MNKTAYIFQDFLLPKDKTCTALWVDGCETDYEIKRIGESNYVDFVLTDLETSKVIIQIDFAN